MSTKITHCLEVFVTLDILLVVLVVGGRRELFWDKPLLGREEPQSQRF